MQRPADASGSDRGEALPRGHRVGAWEVTGPIGAGGWATVHAGRRAADATPGTARMAAVPATTAPPAKTTAPPATTAPPGTAATPDTAGAADGGPPGEVALKVLPTGGLAPRQARAIAESARREVELARRAGHPG